jgi:hypothetical protein
VESVFARFELATLNKYTTHQSSEKSKARMSAASKVMRTSSSERR